MNTRMKKLIVLVAFVPALIIYLGGVLLVGDYLPHHWFARLIYYTLAGTLWAFPMKPLFAWVNKPMG